MMARAAAKKKSTPAQDLEIAIEITCTDSPGLRAHGFNHVHLGIQQDQATIELQSADLAVIRFRPVMRVRWNADGSPNFLGPFSQGTKENRFIYLVWAEAPRRVPKQFFGRIKLLLQHISREDIIRAVKQENTIRVTLGLTDGKGRPVFASVKPGWAKWELQRKADN